MEYRGLFGDLLCDLLCDLFYWCEENSGGYLVGTVAGQPAWLNDKMFPEG